MGFRVSLQSKKGVPRSVLRAKVTADRPLAFQNGLYQGNYGVYTVIHKGKQRRAYFYPGQVIEQKVAARGGRASYVYNEGFNSAKMLARLAPSIQSELPAWRPALSPAQSFLTDKFKISQPGVDMWRMLCLALDYSDGPDLEPFPPLFAIRSPRLGTVLLAGNHRCLFAHAMDRPLIKMVQVNLSALAVNYTTALINCLGYVKDSFGSDNVLALATSFIRQVERRG
ncbi:hypothetical protein ACFL37_01820 [Candidatus Margulisiibacteriota bacterium]